MDLVAFEEAQPDVKWLTRFRQLWPRYRSWYLSEGLDARPSAEEGRRTLVQYMPELVGIYDRACELVGDDDVARRFLTFYRPPPIISGCSVTVLPGGEPVLIRNYDFGPDLFEGAIVRGRWSGHEDVIATSECFLGALDGMNAAGLVAALTFGGRPVHGDGFGIPIMIRYVLECCTTVKEAATALSRIPCAMSQNVMLLDATGDYTAVYLSPDRDPISRHHPVTTNHQLQPEWPTGDRWSETVERADLLCTLREKQGITVEEFVEAFHAPPLYRTNYAEGLGTLYTAVFKPQRAMVEYRWPDRPPWILSFEAFQEGARKIPGSRQPF